MGKRIIYFALVLCLTGQIFAQQEELSINYDSIQAKVENKNSPFFYPKLLEKYNNFDNSLSLEEYALIYYGFTFQKNYLINQPDEKILNELTEKENFKKLTIECQKILDKNPVSLKANNSMGYALFKLGKSESEWKKYQNRYRMLRKVIVYSGNGLSCETGFKVIYVSDEYNILYDYFDIPKIHTQSLTNNLCDKFIVEPSKYYQTTEIYFDISRKLFRQQNLMEQQNK